MKKLIYVSVKWNHFMDKFGTYVTLFIFVSWCTYVVSSNSVALSIFFAMGIIVPSSNHILGLCEAGIGIPCFLLFRQAFLIPIQFPFFATPFIWGGEQSACAAILALAAVRFSLCCTQKVRTALLMLKKEE